MEITGEAKGFVDRMELSGMRLASKITETLGRKISSRDLEEIQRAFVAAYICGVANGTEECRVQAHNTYVNTKHARSKSELGAELGNLHLIAGGTQNRSCELLGIPEASHDLGYYLQGL